MKKLQFALVSACVLFVFFIVAALFAFNSIPKVRRDAKLLVLLVDGFRHDYVKRDRSNLLGFPRIEKEGMRASHLVPVYPANSYPNLYSIVTGLFPENHGMVMDRMYDHEHHDFFLTAPSPNRLREYWWSDAKTIWTQAVEAGLNVTCFNWDGCEVAHNGTQVVQAKPFRDQYKWRTADRETTRAMYDALDAFQDNELSLAMIYYQQVDEIGHKYGPESNETFDAVRDIDMIVYNVINELHRRKLQETVNLYILSNHGMTTKVHTIDLDNLINFTDVRYLLDKGAVSMIWPINEAARNRIHSSLTAQAIPGLEVYLKDQVPSELRLKGHRRTLPIVLQAHPGYAIEAPNLKGKVWPAKSIVEPGMHGYFTEGRDDDHMFGVMYAYGPAFKRSSKTSPIHQVDHYQLFCHVLGLRASPNNGSWVRVRDFLSY